MNNILHLSEYLSNYIFSKAASYLNLNYINKLSNLTTLQIDRINSDLLKELYHISLQNLDIRFSHLNEEHLKYLQHHSDLHSLKICCDFFDNICDISLKYISELK